MARRADPGRIDVARREAALARLISAGHGRDGATRLVGEWLGGLGHPPGRADWEGLDRWLAERRPDRAGPRSGGPGTGRGGQ